ncbi:MULTISPECIES: site-specific integrase [unclassified Paenibacillus]|uniref:site-specific integrase n=1 Tax=unclassified Paenibacillus TaxID=185978 RepID=UPI001AE3C123|nr:MULTISPECIES: site-specific integrase [unclassified Paenibacillus]MBP1154538.1 integrase [Paenibacillus sp. PvP091]MBP1170078.1 integrase [Paenibacillus sp. PvR098]MBP2441106.1 integrase [Paenibacillus sp. PvP052]
MASIFQNQKTKKWEFVFDHYVNGKRKQVRRKGFKTKRDANDVLITLQTEVKEEGYIGTNKQSVSEFMTYWLENVKKLECEETSYYNNTLYLKNHIIPKMGTMKLQELNPIVCQKFVNEMHQAGYARNTIDRVCTLIKLAFDSAVDYKYMKENHMRKVKLPKSQKQELKVWTVNQANQFLEFTKNRRFFCVYALALSTGMRQGEILGLRWKDVNFGEKTITVSQTLTHYGKRLKSGAKTSSGERTISLPAQLIRTLTKQYEDYVTFKNTAEEFTDLDLVIFNLKNGGTVFPANLTKHYIKDVKGSGLPHISFHSLRHTHATMLIEKNINVKVISERLGHSKIGVTLDVYSHVLPSMQQAAADKLDEMLKW